MPTVNQIAQLLPAAAAIVLFHGWEVIAFDRRDSFDASMYGSWIVTGIQSGAKPGSYDLDIQLA